MTDTASTAETGAAPSLPPTPVRLHHVAYVTGDTSATVDFYSRIMGMPFAAAVLDEKIPSTKEPVPYFHSFFRLGDGEALAFFEAPDLAPPVVEPTAAYHTFRHLALDVQSKQDVDAWHAWLVSNGIDVIGPVDHGIIYSIYFFDPSGVRLELTCSISPDWNRNEASAAAALREWEEVKAHAKATGGDLTAALDDLARIRSHRKNNNLD
ncbi:MAG: VOC family protein [Acidimicrobiia bacterium]